MIVCKYILEYGISCFFCCHNEECKVLVELQLREAHKLMLLPFIVTLEDKCLIDARYMIVAKCFAFEVYFKVVCSRDKYFFFLSFTLHITN